MFKETQSFLFPVQTRPIQLLITALLVTTHFVFNSDTSQMTLLIHLQTTTSVRE